MAMTGLSRTIVDADESDVRDDEEEDREDAAVAKISMRLETKKGHEM
jgi:hypothetical protein